MLHNQNINRILKATRYLLVWLCKFWSDLQKTFPRQIWKKYDLIIPNAFLLKFGTNMAWVKSVGFSFSFFVALSLIFIKISSSIWKRPSAHCSLEAFN